MSVETGDDDLPLQRLLGALPQSLRRAYRWLQRRSPWLRWMLGILLVIGGLFGFLPILGFWMAPLGLLLLAEDMPFLRRSTMRTLGSVQAWWDKRRE